MLRNYLKGLHARRIIPISTIEQQLSNWQATESSLQRTFKLDSFDQATQFLAHANLYTNEKKINARISNVYNSVTVTIQSPEITDREVNAANFLDTLLKKNTIEHLLLSDYYTSHYQRYAQVQYNNQDVPTLIDNNQNFLAVGKDVKLLPL